MTAEEAILLLGLFALYGLTIFFVLKLVGYLFGWNIHW